MNRYERKKGLSAAFDALALVRNEFPDMKIHFIHGGGYDPQNNENVEHFEELQIFFNYFIRSKKLFLEISCQSWIHRRRRRRLPASPRFVQRRQALSFAKIEC